MSLQSKIISFRGKIEKIFSNKVVLGTLAMVLLGGVVFGAVKLVAMATEKGEDDVYVSPSDIIYYGNDYNTNIFHVETSDGSHTAVCGEPMSATAEGVATVYDPLDYNYTESQVEQMKRVLLVTVSDYDSDTYNAFNNEYPGTWNDLARTYDSTLYDYSAYKRAYTIGHILIGKIYTGQYDRISSAYASALDSTLATINSWFEENKPDLSSIKLYVAELNSDAGGSSYQEVIWIEVPEVKKIRMRASKRDAEDKTVYMDGATFRLYKRGTSNAYADRDTSFDVIEGIETGTAAGGNHLGYTKYFVFDADGSRYCFEEMTAPDGYAVYPKPKCSNPLTEENYPNLNFTIAFNDTREIIPTGAIVVQKRDSEYGNTAQSPAKLSNTVFTVYDSNDQVVDTITTAKNGDIYSGRLDDLPLGTYTVKETKAGTGYVKNTDWVGTCTISNDSGSALATFKVTVGGVTSGEITNDEGACEFVDTISPTNDVIKGGVSVEKKDASTDRPMAGVKFEVYRKGDLTTPVLDFTTGSDGKYSTTNNALSYGSYVLREVAGTANEGYLLAEDYSFAIKTNGQIVAVPTEAIENTPNESSEFSTNLAEDDSTPNTVALSDGVTLIDTLTFPTGHKPIKTRSYRFKVYVYGIKANASAPDSQPIKTMTTARISGSLLQNTYNLEIAGVPTVDYPGGRLVVKTVMEAFDDSTYITVFTHNEGLNDSNEMVTVEDPEYSLSSEACRIGTSGGSCKKDLGMGQTGVADKVTIDDGLISGHSYLVKAKAVCFSEGATSGTTLAEQNSVTINATSETTSTTIELSFDSTTCGAGKKVGVQNQLFEVVNGSVSGAALAEHNMDLSNPAQTVTILTPTVTTTATSSGAKVVALNATAKIQDKVEYTGLVQGTQYCLVGKLMNGTTEIASVNSDTFNATGETGTYDMEFTFNSEALEGKTLLVNEYLYRGACGTGALIAKHENGTNQTVTVTEKTPWIGTKASAQGGETNLLQPTTGQVIIDKVQYRNLKVGQKYTLFGDLMKSATEKFSTATSGIKLVFTPETRDGEISVTFPAIDATNLAGQTLVVFERLYQGELSSETGTPVAKHEDFSDGNQAVVVKPKVGTKVAEEQSGLAKVGIGNAFIIDTVKYEGLEMGKTYTAKGWLVDAAGQKIAGSEGTKQFTIGEGDTPETSGEVKVKMALRTVGLGGKKVVAYEEVYLGSTLIADHKDINDPSQTLDVEDPAVGTSAKDKVDGDQELATSSEAVIVDTVDYKGLVIGSEYCVRGTLMDKESEKAVTVTNGENVGNIESSACFKAERAEGSVDMEFKFDATNYGGKVFVVFETLYLVEADASAESGKKETEIAKHHNINDTAQTVTVKLNPPETGMSTRDDSGAKLVFGSVATIVMGMAGYGIYLARSKKKYNAE